MVSRYFFLERAAGPDGPCSFHGAACTYTDRRGAGADDAHDTLRPYSGADVACDRDGDPQGTATPPHHARPCTSECLTADHHGNRAEPRVSGDRSRHR